MCTLVDEFNIASKLAMVAQAKLGQQQLKAAEDCKRLLAAQKKIAVKEEEVAKMLNCLFLDSTQRFRVSSLGLGGWCILKSWS